MPDLPKADRPNVERYTKFLLDSGWDFNDNLIIGHSAGAVEVLHLLEKFPESTKANAAIMVAIFKGDLGWEALRDLANVKYDYGRIKNKARKLIVIHSDDDPHCPIDGAREIATELSAEMIIMHDMKHFNVDMDSRFTKFPELLEVIKTKI